MKIYIKSTISNTRNYDRVRASKVTRDFVISFFNKNSVVLSKSQINDIVSGILMWKNKNGLCYHHVDLNPRHNEILNNILLITSSAHGYIHIPSVELKLYRRYHLVIPGYIQGPKAEELELEMYNKLFDELGGSAKYCVLQLVEPLLNYVSNNPSFDANDILNYLSGCNIIWIDKHIIADIVNSVDYNNTENVNYVDEVTGAEISNLIVSKYANSEDKFTQTTIQCILDFINSNMMTREEILKYCIELDN